MTNGHQSSVGGRQGAPRGYRDLEVYTSSFALLKPVHGLASSFPDIERYDLANQMRRAAKSIPANIAEGYALRDLPRLFCKHLRIAYGSATEMRVHIDTAHELGYIDEPTRERFESNYGALARQIYRLWQHWRQKLPAGVSE